MSIKDLPRSTRPRDRLMTSGASVLSDAELLAVILGKGCAGFSSLRVAESFLKTLGGVEGLHDCSVCDLVAIRGIGAAQAARFMAISELSRRMSARPVDEGERLVRSRQVAEWFSPFFKGVKKEEFWVVCLDAANRVVGRELISIGSQTQTIVHPRETFRMAVKRGATGIIVIHNHPAGNPEPSPEDRSLTARLIKVGQVLGIPVLDHVIIGNGNHYSFADRGELR